MLRAGRSVRAARAREPVEAPVVTSSRREKTRHRHLVLQFIFHLPLDCWPASDCSSGGPNAAIPHRFLLPHVFGGRLNCFGARFAAVVPSTIVCANSCCFPHRAGDIPFFVRRLPRTILPPAWRCAIGGRCPPAPGLRTALTPVRKPWGIELRGGRTAQRRPARAFGSGIGWPGGVGLGGSVT